MSQGAGKNTSINAQGPTYRNTGNISSSNYNASGLGYGSSSAQPIQSAYSSNNRASNYAPQPANIVPSNIQQSSYKPTVPENHATYSAHYVPASNTYEVDQYSRSSAQNRVSQPQPQPAVVNSNVNDRQSFQAQQKKIFNPPCFCWGLLGLIALAGLVLGILFGVGVLGRSDTVIENKTNSPSNTNNSTTTPTSSSSTVNGGPSSSTITTKDPNTGTTTTTTTTTNPTQTTTSTSTSKTTSTTGSHNLLKRNYHMRQFSDFAKAQ